MNMDLPRIKAGGLLRDGALVELPFTARLQSGRFVTKRTEENDTCIHGYPLAGHSCLECDDWIWELDKPADPDPGAEGGE